MQANASLTTPRTSRPAPPLPDVSARSSRARERAAGATLNVEALAWGLVVLIAAAWRLPGLGESSPMTAESLRARAAWDYARGAAGGAWVGDLASAAAALAIHAGGDTIGRVRLPAALFGLACVPALALLRPAAGRAVALVAALLLACSPVAVTSARALDPDTAGLLCGLLTVWLAWRIGERGDGRLLPLLGLVAGLAFTTGAVAAAMMIIIVAWIGVETTWLDRREVGERWRAAVGDRGLAGAAVALALPGLLLGVLRFGAGPDGLSPAALTGWAGLPAGGTAWPWHAPLTLLAAYEPLVLSLGLAGAVGVIVRWRRDAASVTPFERLLVVWAGAALVLSVVALHDGAGQLMLLALPLMALAASATVQAAPSLAALRPREIVPAAAAVGLTLGYAALKYLSWANLGVIPDTKAWGALALVIAAVLIVALVLRRTPAATEGTAVAACWLLLGVVSLHGVSAVAYAHGVEPLRGGRSVAPAAALWRGVEAAGAEDRPLAVERRLAAALAWDLRNVDARPYVGIPPETGFVLRGPDGPMTDGAVALGPVATVEERWYFPSWNTLGALRWMVYRESWGPARVISGQVVQSADKNASPAPPSP